MRFLGMVLCAAFLAMPITAWIEEGEIKWDYNCRWDNSIHFASEVSHADECGRVCFSRAGCKAFNWDPSQQICLLFRQTSDILNKNGWICGYIDFLKSAGNSTLDN